MVRRGLNEALTHVRRTSNVSVGHIVGRNLFAPSGRTLGEKHSVPKTYLPTTGRCASFFFL